jgi:hypothetical protein
VDQVSDGVAECGNQQREQRLLCGTAALLIGDMRTLVVGTRFSPSR